MTTATTRQAIRRELYNQIPGLGFSGTADSVTTTTIVDAFALADTAGSTVAYKGMYIYRPELATDDRVKKATTLVLATGALSHGSTNYADTTDTEYEIVGPMHPDELNSCITRAMTRIYYDVQVPLCGEITDGDMDASTTTSWTNVLSPATEEKVTTAAKVYSGIRALHVLNNSAGEGKQSVTIKGFAPNGGEWVYASAIVHADVGTAELHVYNVTGSASIASVTSNQEGWAHLWLRVQLPSGCEEIALQLLGTESNADLYWNHAMLYRVEQRSHLPAPSWLDDQWKFLKLREARYLKSHSSQTYGGYDDAGSRTFHDWSQPAHYSLDPLHIDTNPYMVQLMRPMPQNELWIQGKRPYSDSEDLSTESSTTRAPLRLVYAYAKDEIARVLRKRFPQDKRWEQLLAEATAEVESETRARPELPMTPIRTEYWGRV